MNVNIDISGITRFLRGILAELHSKRLWPVAVVLLAAIAAVPVLLSKSTSPAPAPAAVPGAAAAPQPALPVLSVQTTPSHSRLTGPARDPFPSGSGTKGATTTTTTSSPAASSVSHSTSVTVTGTANVGGAPTSSATVPPPVSITDNAKPTPAPKGLSPTEAYDVALTVGTSSGGLDTINPLERLSVLPSPQMPMITELGVLQGGQRVLFVLQPGTVVAGPGTCTPAAIDCEILSLAQDQTEQIGRLSSAGLIDGPLFAVTGIAVHPYPSVAAASKARRQESAAGRALLAKSPLTALSLFQYQPSLGVVVDERNLNVGTS